MILDKVDKKVRSLIATAFRGRFPHLYSTLDNPVQVPVQLAAYKLAVKQYIQSGDRVLDVGFGLGYGLKMMAEQARELMGIEIDQKSIRHIHKLASQSSKIFEFKQYDGINIPYDDNFFDVVTCIDVLEHVPDYLCLIDEMIRVSRLVVFISTPNRRPEHTRPDGKPKNYWHLREWSSEELTEIINTSTTQPWEWNFINGPWEGPFTYSSIPESDTQALAPALFIQPGK